MMQVELLWEYELWDQPTDMFSLISIELRMTIEELYRFMALKTSGTMTPDDLSDESQ